MLTLGTQVTLVNESRLNTDSCWQLNLLSDQRVQIQMNAGLVFEGVEQIR